MNIKSIKLITLLKLLTLFTLTNLCFGTNSFKDSYNNNTSTTSQCDAQEATSLFILNALFANTESPYPIELWENRDNPALNIFDLAREIKSIANYKETIFNNADNPILLQRLSQMQDIADRALIMEADKWKPSYVNELMKHIIGIRHAGISDLLPDSVDPSNCQYEDGNKHSEDSQSLNIINPCDKNGERWTSLTRLTEPNDQGPSIANYMLAHGTDIQLIQDWWGRQINDSWFLGCSAVKAFYSNQRTVDIQSYYWTNEGYQAAEDEYSAFWRKGASADYKLCYPTTTNKEDDYINAFTIWHAYVQEVLAKTQFYHNNPANKTLCAIRTNGTRSLKVNNITGFGNDYTIPSAAYDSFSLINVFRKGSSGVITESLTPHHRVIHLYPLLEKKLDEELASLKNHHKEKVDFLKKYYDEKGMLIINKAEPNSTQMFIEECLYRIYKENIKHNINSMLIYTTDFGLNFDNFKTHCLNDLTALPEQLPVETLTEDLLNTIIFKEHELIRETEVVILSGPDLPFDYFYNADDNLSDFEQRIGKGEGVCGYWPNLNDLKQIGHLGGSTGTELHQNTKNGKKYVLKRGASPGHIHEEALADKLYAAMGHSIPESRLYENSEVPVKVATYLENSKSLGDAYDNADDTEKKRLRDEVSKGFLIDALLANFDVVGLDMDNILVGPDGKVYRVDNGSSFRYRAQGKLKNDSPDESLKSWNPSPIALWTLRDPAKNPNCAKIFADVNIYELTDSIIALSEAYPQPEGPSIDSFKHHKVLDKEPELKAQTETRFKNFKEVAFKALEMKVKGLTVQEADIELRKWVEEQDWGPAF